MKYLRLVSDIHLDLDVAQFRKTRSFNTNDPKSVALHEKLKEQGEMGMCWFPEPMEGDDDTVLVIAGDLWVERRFLDRKFPDGESWMKKLSRQFKYVVFVLGNHDYWSQNLLYEPGKVWDELQEQKLDNVYMLEKLHVELDQVKFVGATLWTDLNRCDPLITGQARTIMNDYQYIRTGHDYRRMQAMDTYESHMNAKRYIFANAKRDYPEQKVVVVTHMAPSYQSIHSKFRDYESMKANFFYYSDLERRIRDDGREIDYWMHGHVHMQADYKLDPNVRVLCNPRGYPAEDTDFDPLWRIML